MDAPGVTRYRRPFLAPVWLTMLAVACALGVVFAIYRSASTASTTIVALVQPAEEQAGTIADPPLSPEGEQRAQMLAQMLGETSGVGRLDAIYVSNGRRAQQIINPLAERLGMHPEVIESNDAGGIASRLTRGHDGAAVLFVGNGGNIPQLVHELSGIEVGAASDREHDMLYVVAIPAFGRASVLRLKY